jgi:hypothetical protein
VADRLTMVPLLGALLDYDSDPDTYARYDAMTARELFRQYGASGSRGQGALSSPLTWLP